MRFVRIWRIAFSSRIASLTYSATIALIAGSPKEPSMRDPKPPTNPFTPHKADFRDLDRLPSGDAGSG